MESNDIDLANDDNLLMESKENREHSKSKGFFHKRRKLFTPTSGSSFRKKLIIKNIKTNNLKIGYKKHNNSQISDLSPYNFSSRPGTCKPNGKYLF